MNPTEEELDGIQAAYELALSTYQDWDAAISRRQRLKEQYEVAKKVAAYDSKSLGLQALGMGGDPVKVNDIPAHKLAATIKGVEEVIGDLELAHLEAKGDFRVRVQDAMRNELARALDRYELRASALIQSWEEVANIRHWFASQRLDSGLPTDFVSGVRIPPAVQGKAALLDGQRAHNFRCDITELLNDDAIEMYHGKYAERRVVEAPLPERNQPRELNAALGR